VTESSLAYLGCRRAALGKPSYEIGVYYFSSRSDTPLFKRIFLLYQQSFMVTSLDLAPTITDAASECPFSSSLSCP
jgi:hypothetical protein